MPKGDPPPAFLDVADGVVAGIVKAADIARVVKAERRVGELLAELKRIEPEEKGGGKRTEFVRRADQLTAPADGRGSRARV